jgi:hypothetical protein
MRAKLTGALFFSDTPIRVPSATRGRGPHERASFLQNSQNIFKKVSNHIARGVISAGYKIASLKMNTLV